MIDKKHILKIKQILGEENCFENEPMKNHTTFRIGGPARLFTTPPSVDALSEALAYCRNEKILHFAMGNGSNLLVSDNGYEGVIFQIYKNLNNINLNEKDDEFEIEAGALLSSIANFAMENSYSGFEFASGIPGTLGGAIIMNAGAYGDEIGNHVTEVTVLTQKGEFKTFNKEELHFSYRNSSLKGKENIVLSVKLKLEKADKEEIKARMEELKKQRVEKQPLAYPSAGSTFKRPEGHFAGKLIMDAGFRGYRVGGAQVSEKHCGFVINKGEATASDVMTLVKEIQDKILKLNNVKLELEVERLGEF